MRLKISLLVVFCSLLLLQGTKAHAVILKKPEDALKGVFRNAAIEVKNIILRPEQVAEIEKISGMRQNERLVSFYEAKRDNKIVGYAFIESHIVRTKPETLLYSLHPDGSIDRIEVLSFNEPMEYLPQDRWLGLFKDKSIDRDPIRLRRDISGITGATLTAKAITDGSRRVLAIWKVLFGGQDEILRKGK
ncbi:MAG: FMN-binding protein [Alphaproteobacteria bacterium]|uniref:FMN-binding protein n=1 Tax=Candidatus Nitrobium versatile TaxID=2884831 RepID=A0A953J9G8_9BACT|nr:FMN-binding protein [Candidatus Nitrobium versatile]